jgi:NAD(P) transhydrogenase subunit alpha
MMPLMMTAAGTIFPAKVFVIGAGVAGLQAVATAKRLGAVVEAFDTRPVVKEQVESLGGRFVQLVLEAGTEDARGYARELTAAEKEKEKSLIAKHTAGADIVITTALVPGRKAPLIITADMVRSMRPGSVIVDLAADAGGNCELTAPGKEIEVGGVKIIGFFNIPGLMAPQASALYSRNIYDFILEICPKGQWVFDPSNPVQKDSLVTKDGRVVNEMIIAKIGASGPGVGGK